MAKKPGKGRCVHCLKEEAERNWDHVLPKSWYPDTTEADLEKWQIPSCVACNDRYGKLERDLIGRLGLALDAGNPASAGLADRALRAINPDAAKNEGDAAARDARAKKILGEMYKGEELKGKNVVPGLHERWDRSLEEQLGISIPEESLPAMTEKIVRGITFREDGAFIEPDQEIKSFLVKDEDVKDVKEMLDGASTEFKRTWPCGPAGTITRRRPVRNHPLESAQDVRDGLEAEGGVCSVSASAPFAQAGAAQRMAKRAGKTAGQAKSQGAKACSKICPAEAAIGGLGFPERKVKKS